jgi:cell division protease FtsH
MMTGKDPRSQASSQEPAPEVRDQNSRPWRTEGVPKAPPPKGRPKWTMLAVWLLGYILFFGVLTMQDRMSGPAAVPYTEFKTQVANKNVAEVFARGNTIEGALKKEAPLPGQSATKGQQVRNYQKFTTERPTFAADDLLAELTATGAMVRATPLVQQRGVLTNLLISIAPFLLLVAFYIWMFKRQKAAMGGGIFGGGAKKSGYRACDLRGCRGNR